jgi:hypothetical protein
VFGAVAKADTDIAALIRRKLETVGQTDDTDVTAFTDGCPGLRSILADVGVTKPPILDWFTLPCGCSTQRRPPADYRRTIPTG